MFVSMCVFGSKSWTARHRTPSMSRLICTINHNHILGECVCTQSLESYFLIVYIISFMYLLVYMCVCLCVGRSCSNRNLLIKTRAQFAHIIRKASPCQTESEIKLFVHGQSSEYDVSLIQLRCTRSRRFMTLIDHHSNVESMLLAVVVFVVSLHRMASP